MSPNRTLLALLILLIPALIVGPARAQGPGLGDWGDAPDGVLAYPSLGVIGQFPTCFGGAGGFVWHAPAMDPVNMFWGFTADHEGDGNAGFCPAPPYERDECWGPFDGDGGLAIPDPFTIDLGNQVVPCGQQPPVSLGNACSTISLVPGGPFEANLINNMVLDGFVNIVFDWNQDGRWGGASVCPNGLAPEHAVVNLPVPPLYSGPLSGLNPPPIHIGPNSGYVWIRMTISPAIGVQTPWDGSGMFDGGETEDYLLRIDDPIGGGVGELGDAPENAPAYPNGVMGAFPTCIASGPAGFVFHTAPATAWFGPLVDTEAEGNANFCPQPPYDQDECGVSDGDAGLLFPDAWTFDPAGGSVVRCPTGNNNDLWRVCDTARWGVHVDIDVTNNSPDERYVNVMVDWDQDGQWTNVVTNCPNGNVYWEHVLADWRIPAGFSGPLSTLSPPDFNIGGAVDWVWVRFTISDTQAGPGWDGSGNFGDGETEDYMFLVEPQPVSAPGVPELQGALRLDGASPNPFNPRTTVVFTAAREGVVRMTIHDASGRRVRTLFDGRAVVGRNEVRWNGTDDDGRTLPSGVYFARAVMDGQVETAKLVLVR